MLATAPGDACLTVRSRGEPAGFKLPKRACWPDADSRLEKRLSIEDPFETHDSPEPSHRHDCAATIHAKGMETLMDEWARAARLLPSCFYVLGTGLLHEYMGQKRRKCPKKACLEFVAAPQPAHAARKHRSRVGGTPWHPVSAANRPDGTGSTPRSLWGCNKLAAERATDGVPAEVMECET